MNAITDKQLVVIEPKNVMTVFSTPGAIDPILARIRQEIDAFVAPDVKTKKGRETIASFANDIAKSKTYLDALGKSLVDDLKDIPKKVDANRKKVRDTLDAWKAEVRAPLTEWEQFEDDRKNKHRAVIDGLNSTATAPIAGFAATTPIAHIIAKLGEVEAIIIGPQCEEFETEYARGKDGAIRALRAALEFCTKYQAEQEELSRLRAAEAEREAQERRRAEEAAAADRERIDRERQDRVIAEATERAQRAAEESARRELQAAERRRQDEIDAAARREKELQEQAAAAERRAAEAEAKAKREIEEAARQADEETARREKNKAHVAHIHRKVLAALVNGGIAEEIAKQAITLIARNQIPFVSISY